MTPQEIRFLRRLEERARELAPELQAALLLAFRLLRGTLKPAALARLIEAGDVEGAVRLAFTDEIVQRAFAPVRQRIREGTIRNAKVAFRHVPTRGTPTIGIRWDVLDPSVLEAVRTIESGAIRYTAGDIRDAFRAAITQGLEAGVNPRVIAEGLRDVVGLTPYQEGIIGNFQRAIREGDYRKALTYELRDKRFDPRLRRLLKQGGTLTPAQVDEMGRSYRRKYVRWNAENLSHTAAREAQRVGQQLAWKEAKAAGLLGDGEIIKIWLHSDASKVPRPHHLAMDKSEAPLEKPYSNGDMYPGQQDPFGCKCTEKYRVKRR